MPPKQRRPRQRRPQAQHRLPPATAARSRTPAPRTSTLHAAPPCGWSGHACARDVGVHGTTGCDGEGGVSTVRRATWAFVVALYALTCGTCSTQDGTRNRKLCMQLVGEPRGRKRATGHSYMSRRRGSQARAGVRQRRAIVARVGMERRADVSRARIIVLSRRFARGDGTPALASMLCTHTLLGARPVVEVERYAQRDVWGGWRTSTRTVCVT